MEKDWKYMRRGASRIPEAPGRSDAVTAKYCLIMKDEGKRE
jgi:hypothetical protein